MRRRFMKRILIGLLVIFILIQFIRPNTNKNPGVQPNSVFTRYPASPQVTAILEKACNDCHSNNTNYPWYSHIQPVAWWMSDHVKDGKKELNFDEFVNYSPKKQHKKFEEIKEMVKEGEMPLKSYTWIHGDAKLTAGEKQAIINWASQAAATISYLSEK
jgi:hypothetical protein